MRPAVPLPCVLAFCILRVASSLPAQPPDTLSIVPEVVQNATDLSIANANIGDISDSQNALTWYPYTRKIPNTDMTMKLKFRRPLTRDKVSAVLSATEAIVNRQIEDHGEDAQLLINGQGKQAFRNVVNGNVIAIGNLPPEKIVWGNVRDLLLGLDRYCPNQECAFEFSVGSGPAIGNGHLGKGNS